MEFRAYTPGDSEAIENLFVAVFSDSEGEEEGALVGVLAKELIVSSKSRDLYGFVAVDKEQVVGALFFSRLTFETEETDVFILAPVAVHTEYQGLGVGQALITRVCPEMALSESRKLAYRPDLGVMLKK